MSAHSHVHLHVAGSKTTQPVPVERLPDGTFRAAATPGMVLGLAAGDVFRLVDEASGEFEVIVRGGNVGLQIFCSGAIEPAATWLTPRVEALGGWWDGQISRAVVFTVPFGSGFDPIESLMTALCAEFQGIEWLYANVYDENDLPLNWWEH